MHNIFKKSKRQM